MCCKKWPLKAHGCKVLTAIQNLSGPVLQILPETASAQRSAQNFFTWNRSSTSNLIWHDVHIVLYPHFNTDQFPAWRLHETTWDRRNQLFFSPMAHLFPPFPNREFATKEEGSTTLDCRNFLEKEEKWEENEIRRLFSLVAGAYKYFFCIHCISAAYFQGYPFVKLLLLNLQKLHFSHAKECTLFKVS